MMVRLGLAQAHGRLAPEPVEPDRAQVEHVRERHVAVLAGSVVGLGARHVERHALDVERHELEQLAAARPVDERERVAEEARLQHHRAAELVSAHVAVRLPEQRLEHRARGLDADARRVLRDERARPVDRRVVERGERSHRRHAGTVRRREHDPVRRVVADPALEQFPQHGGIVDPCRVRVTI
jgi:hypothetical protein